MWIRMAFTIRNIAVLLLICSSNGSGTTTTTRARGALMFSTTRFPSFIRSTTTYTPYTTTSTSVSASATTAATTTNATVTATATVTPMRDVAHEQVSPNTTRSMSVGEDLEDNSISQGIIAGVVVGTTLVAAAIITSILLIRRYRGQTETSAESLTEVTTTDQQASGIDNVTRTSPDNNNSQRSQNDRDSKSQTDNDLDLPPTGHAGLVEPVHYSSVDHVHINPLTANTAMDYVNPLADNTPMDNINPSQHNPSADFNPPPNIHKQHLKWVQSSSKTPNDDDYTEDGDVYEDHDENDDDVDDCPYFDYHVLQHDGQNDDDKQQQHNHPDLQTDAMTYMEMNSPSLTGEGVNFGMIYEYMEKEKTEYQPDPLEEYENFKPCRPDLDEESSSVHQVPKTPESIICERISQEYEDLNAYQPDRDNSANDEPISVGEDPYFDHHVHQEDGPNNENKHQQHHLPDLKTDAMTYMDMNSPSQTGEGVDFGMTYEYMVNEEIQPQSDPLEEYENFKPCRPDLDKESLSACQVPGTFESMIGERVSQEYEDFNPYLPDQDNSPPDESLYCSLPEGNEQYERLSSANEYSNIRINLSSDIYENVEYQNSDYSNVDSFA